MPEIPQNGTPTTNTNPTNQGTINLNNFSLNPNSTPQTTAPIVNFDMLLPKTDNTQNPISNGTNPIPNTPATNFSLNTNGENSGFNLSSLSIKAEKPKDDTEAKKKTNELLSAVEDPNIKKEKKPLFDKVQLIVGGYILIFINILAITGIRTYSQYITLENQQQIDPEETSFVEKMENIETLLSKYTQINNYATMKENNSLLTNEATKNTATDTIKSEKKLNFSQKRKILQKNIDNLSNNIITNQTTLNDIKNEIEKYGFIPKELFEMTQKKDAVTGIRRAMLLRENMKFITAFKVFGYMDSFIQSFANYTDMDPEEAKTKINELNKNGEKDIISYTNNCYFNPYEIGSDCSITRDFDNYYNIIDTKSKISSDFVKKLSNYIDKKLEETEIPTYTIMFPEFDSRQSTINFSTDINTNKQDEIALTKAGITNPHLYIVTNLINTLQQSLLVIGENIKVNQIRIEPKTVRIGSTSFTVNNSKLEFSLPIQKTEEREISDFFNSPDK